MKCCRAATTCTKIAVLTHAQVLRGGLGPVSDVARWRHGARVVAQGRLRRERLLRDAAALVQRHEAAELPARG